MGDFKKLKVYQKAFNLAMEVFEVSKSIPIEEKYGLISQVRRSSRSVCSNIAEAYRKRQYPAHFCVKISDADMENSESQVWFDFAFACKYISPESYKDLLSKSHEIGRLLSHMLNHPQKYKLS